MKSIRIAHISDLHLSKISLNPIHLFTKRWVGILNLIFSRRKIFCFDQVFKLLDLFKKENINMVIITGDLSSTSLKDEYLLAKSFIDKLKENNIKVLVIPGNHDIYTKRTDKKKIFYKTFENDKEEQDYPFKNYSLKNDNIEVHPIIDNWYAVLLDTAISTSIISSRGYFSKNLEKKLKTTLKKFSPTDKIILVNHFPFFEHESPRKKLIRSHALRKIIQNNNNIKFYLHGHTHSHIVADLRENHLSIVLDSGCISHKEKGRWNLLNLNQDSCDIDVFQCDNADWKKIKEFHFKGL